MMANQREDIIAYFNQLDRSYFISEKNKHKAHLDSPLPIGHGQTISQPSLVLNMTLALNLNKDLNVLEIGTGSGYQTALLAAFSKNVFSVERIEKLHLTAKERLEKRYSNIHFKLGDGSLGWKEHAPYHRIMVTASASEVPKELLDQLSFNGRMIIPIGKSFFQELRVIDKDDTGKITSTSIEDVAFVRLKGKYE